MRVTIVAPLAVRHGGAETLLLHLLKANRTARALDCNVFFLEDGPMLAEVEALGYAVTHFPVGQLRDLLRAGATVRRLRRWIRSRNSAVVLSWQPKAHLYAGLAVLGLKIPAVWWQHGITAGNWMDRLATAIPCTGILCCSEAARKAQARLGRGRALRVVHPAVDLSRFDSSALPGMAEARRMLGLPIDARIVGTVCRLQRQKGVHVLLAAARLLIARGVPIHLVIVGGAHPLEPDYAEELRRYAGDPALTSHLTFTGPQDNVSLWMQALDVFALPSVGKEGFGMVLIEAMALGKPVVATRTGGPEEIVRDGIDGWLTEPASSEALADALERSLVPGAARVAMADAARSRASEFGTDHFAASAADGLAALAGRRVRELSI